MCALQTPCGSQPDAPAAQSFGCVLERESSFPPVPLATEATGRGALALRPPSHVWRGSGLLHQALCSLAVAELYTRPPLTPASTSGALAHDGPIFLTLTLKTGVPGCHPGSLSPLNELLPACSRGSEDGGSIFLP